MNFILLPFNTIIKWGPRVREEEAMAISFAHSLGLPVPRLLSYGDGFLEGRGSIWMTVLPGEPLSQVWNKLTREQKITIVGEIDQCILRMRQCRNPDSSRISSLAGSHIASFRACYGIIPPCRNKSELLDYLMSARDSKDYNYAPGEFDLETETIKSIERKPHSIVFTHGDLFPHNILIKDGHLSGIVDWGCAGWLPEYWDYTTITLRRFSVTPPSEWNTLLYSNPGFIYLEELMADYKLVAATCLSFPRH